MKTDVTNNYDIIIKLISNNEVVALPAEFCFGLSALPSLETVNQILMLKKRQQAKGFILVGHHIDVFKRWIDYSSLTKEQKQKLQKNYDHPISWLVPVSKHLPSYIKGNFNTVAIRITKHPVLSRLTEQLNTPLISTSANLQNLPPALTVKEVLKYFDGKITAIFDGHTGDATAPSQIINLLTGQIIR